MLIRVRTMHAPYQAAFPSFSSHSCPGTSWFPGTSITDLWRETIHSQCERQEVREKQSNEWVPWAPAPPNGEEGSPLPWFASCCLVAAPQNFLWAEEKKGEGRRDKRDPTPLPELEKYPFRLWVKPEGLGRSFCLQPELTASSRCPEPRSGGTRGKTPALWDLEFWELPILPLLWISWVCKDLCSASMDPGSVR